MTTEEAIKRLEKLKAIYFGMDIKSDIEALDMAIKALSAEQIDGDLISRTDLLNAIWQKEYGIDYDGANLLNIKHIDIIEQMPSAENTDGDFISRDFMKKIGATCIAKRSETGELVAISNLDILPSAEKIAEWKIVGKTTLHYECSICGGAGDKWDKFCKHCGRKMKGAENE